MLSCIVFILSLISAAMAQTPTRAPTRVPTLPPTQQPTMSPSTSPVKGYRAVVIVIVVSCCVGVGMFVMLAIIVSIKRGNACSEHGPCANCCGEQQGNARVHFAVPCMSLHFPLRKNKHLFLSGFCCADIDKTSTIDPVFKCCSPTEGFYSQETYGCVGSMCMPNGGFSGQKEAAWCSDDRCWDCCTGGEMCVPTGAESLPAAPVVPQPALAPAFYAPNPLVAPVQMMPGMPVAQGMVMMAPPGGMSVPQMQQPMMMMPHHQQQQAMMMQQPMPYGMPGHPNGMPAAGGAVELSGFYSSPTVPV